jgi:hypothetical protein
LILILECYPGIWPIVGLQVRSGDISLWQTSFVWAFVEKIGHIENTVRVRVSLLVFAVFKRLP